MGDLVLAFMVSAVIVLGANAATTTTGQTFGQTDADHYLSKFGYMELLPTGQKAGAEGQQLEQKRQETRKSAIKLFQEYAGLPATGKLDEKTIKTMKRPRCGRKDIIRVAGGETGSLRDAISETGAAYKWDQSTLQWALKRPTSKLDPARTRDVLNKALDVWSKVVPLDFTETGPESDPPMQVGFGAGQHGDPWPFDGPGNVLAHASYPKDGRLHFDDDEKWVIDDPARLLAEPDAVDLFSVAVHEIGHALGVFHLKQQEAIMYPIYQPPIDENGNPKPFRLSQYDIDAIRKLYGPRRGTAQRPTPAPATRAPPSTTRAGRGPAPTERPVERPVPTERPVERPVPTERPTGGSCPQIDVAVTAADGATYFISGNSVWKKDRVESSSTATTRYTTNQLFPSAPTSGLTAGVVTPLLQSTLLFQGRRVFGYTWWPVTKKFTLRLSYPIDLPDEVDFVPQDVFQWKDGNIILFKGDRFVIWDQLWNKVTFRGKMSDYFPNFPTSTKASFSVGDKLYVINGTNYQIYDTRTQEIGAKKPMSTLIQC